MAGNWNGTRAGMSGCQGEVMNGGLSQSLGADTIFLEARRLAKAALPSAVVYATVLTIGGMYIDTLEDVTGPNLMFNIVSLGLTYWFLVSMLQDGGLVSEG